MLCICNILKLHLSVFARVSWVFLGKKQKEPTHKRESQINLQMYPETLSLSHRSNLHPQGYLIFYICMILYMYNSLNNSQKLMQGFMVRKFRKF